MKHAAWLLAISGLAFNLHATSTLKPSETLDAAKIADSMKRAPSKRVAQDTSKAAAAVVKPKVDTLKAKAGPALRPVTPTIPAAIPPVTPTPAAAPATAAPATPATPPATAQPAAPAATPAAPTVVRPPVVPPVVPPVPAPVKDSVLAKRYKILNRPLNKDEVKYFLDAFQLRESGKPDSTPLNWMWRDKKGALMSYEVGSSEMGFANETIPMLSQKDYLPDSLIRFQTDRILKVILKGKADRYVFANYEITMVQKKGADPKEAVQPLVPAFYIGRYLRKVDERIVLGDGFQIRVGYGEAGTLQSFSFRDPVIADGGSVKVPSKEMVMDSLKRWERSKTHTRAYYYPYHPDHLNIRSLKPVKVFESYVTSQEKFRDASQMDGAYLEPSITVLAQVVVAKTKKRLSVPAPEEPILLHFHFPCRPATGLCWPDGNQDLQDAYAPPAQNAPAPASAPAMPTKAPSKPELPSTPAKP